MPGLFVANMKKHAPTEEYQTGKIPDDVFAKLPSIMKQIWVDHRPVDIDMENKPGIPVEKLECIECKISYFHELARGDITEERIKESAKPPSKKKSGILINLINIHGTDWRKTMIFSGMQETYFQVSWTGLEAVPTSRP